MKSIVASWAFGLLSFVFTNLLLFVVLVTLVSTDYPPKKSAVSLRRGNDYVIV